MASKITRTPNPDAVPYQCDEIMQSDMLGPVRITAWADSEHRNGWSQFNTYHIVANLDDALTVNGKTYKAVRADATAYTDSSGNLCGFRPPFAECWSNPLTPSAKSAVMDALQPIVSAYIDSHGGNEATAKMLRNKARQREAANLKRKATDALAEADRILSQIEA